MVKPKQLGHLVIRVRDLEKSERFYSDILGLHVTNKRPGQMTFMSAVDRSSHELALVPVGPDAPGPEADRVGLFHFAWEMESFEDLKELYARMKSNDVNVQSVGDHGISLGVYFTDPGRQRDRGVLRDAKGRVARGGRPFRRRIPRQPRVVSEATRNPRDS